MAGVNWPCDPSPQERHKPSVTGQTYESVTEHETELVVIQ